MAVWARCVYAAVVTRILVDGHWCRPAAGDETTGEPRHPFAQAAAPVLCGPFRKAELPMTVHRHPANQGRHDRRTRGEQLADHVTEVFGSWRFIIVQTVAVVTWIGFNLIAFARHWDPYPFILLNLLFSTQAAHAAPLILLSQNRQADTDRIRAEHDYRVNRPALTYLIAWHRDAHSADCRCVEEIGSFAEQTLSDLGRDFTPRPDAAGAPVTAHNA